MRLRCALETTCRAAAQIGHDTTPYLENNGIAQRAALVEFGDLVNCLMRLCIVALFTKNGTHAMTVLQSREAWRHCERVFDDLREEIDERAEAQKISELAIARSLGVVARQTHEMADAILFWLEERAGGFEAGGHDAVAEPARRSPAPAAESTPDCLSA
ncbi:hypothetical protein [Edaphobacter bradus]|uniref:hypothetical protein n=1 Tax=Edaphobacter bradus TaxID=2259016 RepID=UPI0021E03E14|nr:hypothetical protein [Edaphobacter bradus]